MGNGLVIQTRLDNLDLSIVNAFSPGLGVGGRATGSLDFSEPGGGAFPRAEARLNVTGFTRTGIAVRSSPVDLFIAGNLTPEGGAAGAIIRRGGAIIGRAQVRLQPLGPAAGTLAGRGCSPRRSPAASAITARPTCRCPSPACPATS